MRGSAAAVIRSATRLPDHDGGAHEQRRAEHDGIVAGRNGVGRELPESRPGEHGFDEHRTGEEKRQREPQQRDHRQQGVAQGVAHEHGALGESFGACGAHVVLAQRLEQGGALKAGGAARSHEPERERRQREVAQPVEQPAAQRQRVVEDRIGDPADREPVQPLPEYQEEHQTEPEGRQRIEEQRQIRERHVRAAAHVRRLEHADRDPEHEIEQQRGPGEEDGVGECVADHLGDGAPPAEGLAQLTVGERRQVPRVLHRQRLIEAERGVEPFDRRRIRSAVPPAAGTAGREPDGRPRR